MLRPDFIVKNPGRRSLSKLQLNSFWGRLGMADKNVKSSLIRNESSYYKVMKDTTTSIVDIHVVDQDKLVLETEKCEGWGKFKKDGSVALASFTTCWARLRLYKLMTNLEAGRKHRVLYFDTG